ncbi:MAG TPA: ComEC/Rec2 family competence protein [Bacteroidales bacterium]|nr:ComEC/Rec2 family competence protein [Bacteroidales bacterium]
MNEWHKYPFVRLLTSFVAGLLLSKAFEDYRILEFNIALLISVVLVITASLYHVKINYGNRRVFGILSWVLFIVFGFGWNHMHQLKHKESHFSRKEYPMKYIAGSLAETPVEKENSYKSVIQVRRLIDSTGQAVPAKGNILAYFSKGQQVSEAAYGDKIVFCGDVEQISKNTNPGAFDYAGYLEQMQIYHRVYLTEDAFQILPGKENSLYAVSDRWQQKLTRVLKRQPMEQANFALVSALVLGHDNFLSDDIRKWYSNAGAMHILCVSGLHVGIIYMVMIFLLRAWPEKGRREKTIKAIIVILSIWAYAFITGLEPAVMRASVMFSMVAVGKMLQRKSRIYNTLAASAFIMLLINPDMLSWVGFQMSYLAVFGIVWLQPYISNWWSPRNKFAKYFWDLIAVSLAAQIILFPLLIYYFHKISIVFFITNIFAIPMATVVIYLTLLLFAISWWAWLENVLALMLDMWTGWLNNLMRIVSSWPIAYFDDIWVSFWNVIVIYTVLVFSISALIKNKKYIVPSAIGSLVVVFLILSAHKYQKSTNNRFILYHVNNSFAMDFMKGHSSVFVADSLLLTDKEKLGFQVENSWKSSFVKPLLVSLDELHDSDNGYFSCREQFCLFNGDIFYVLNKMPKVDSSKKVQIDYLVLKGKPWINPGEIVSIFKIRKKVLISGSTPFWLADKWKKAFEKLDVVCYSTHDSGAFIIDYRKNQ